MTQYRENLLLQALAETQPTNSHRLLERLSVRSSLNYRVLENLIERGSIVVLGTAEQLGVRGMRKDAKILALPGTVYEPLRVKPATGEKCRPYVGNVFGPPLKRDLFAHMKLAMMTR